jgi:hypothetical protein
VDPASKSVGWALFEGEYLRASGSVVVKGKNQFNRLAEIYAAFYAGFGDVMSPTTGSLDEVHIETLNYGTHFACIWSVGVIGALFARLGANVSQDIYIKAWQKHADWGRKKGQFETFGYKTEDEFAAVCMGNWYIFGRDKDK